jgi:protein gp37
MKKGNMYEWITDTWNPLAGECLHKCPYCSTNKLAQRWEVVKKKYSGSIRIDDSAIIKSLGHDKTWFVCAQSDLFAKDVNAFFIDRVLGVVNSYPNNTYLFQTKNPERIFNFIDKFSNNSIICTTIETNRSYPEFMGLAPSTTIRAYYMSHIHDFRKFVTIEPIMDFDLEQMVALIKACEPEQVNIGADSGHNNLPEPSKEKVLQLIEELKKFTTIARKTNLERLLKT